MSSRDSGRGGWKLPIRIVYAAGIASLVVFIGFNISDWPGGFLAGFWQGHPIVGATTGTILLLAVGFLAFDYRDRRIQDDLDQKVVAAARSGVVDHLIEIDVALALVAVDDAALLDQWPGWHEPERPLRWLRRGRSELLATIDHSPNSADPRALRPSPTIGGADWQLRLVDESVRRVSAGLKEWGMLMSRSRAGQRDLVAFGSVRVDLLKIEHELLRAGNVVPASMIQTLQMSCRRLAWRFETTSGAPYPRVELVDPEIAFASSTDR